MRRYTDYYLDMVIQMRIGAYKYQYLYMHILIYTYLYMRFRVQLSVYIFLKDGARVVFCAKAREGEAAVVQRASPWLFAAIPVGEGRAAPPRRALFVVQPRRPKGLVLGRGMHYNG